MTAPVLYRPDLEQTTEDEAEAIASIRSSRPPSGPRRRASTCRWRRSRPAQPAWNTARAAVVDDTMSFTPRHGLVAHQPLGG